MAENDGGPAFPQPEQGSDRRVLTCGGCGAVFRRDDGGMSLRDWFAGQALPDMVRRWELYRQTSGKDRDWYCQLAYEWADSMLKAREQ